MRKRRKLGKRYSKKMFKRNAVKTHVRNSLQPHPMRGGIRLQLVPYTFLVQGPFKFCHELEVHILCHAIILCKAIDLFM